MTLVASNVSQDQLMPLLARNFSAVDTKSQYESLRITNGVITLILYTSGKLVVQAKKESEDLAERLLYSLGVDVKDSASKKQVFDTQMISLPHIGSDETLKGDTFGGLVVCAAYVTEELVYEFSDAFVDSKELSDDAICKIAKDVLKKYPSHVEIKELSPALYNKMTTHMNVTGVLNECHREVLSVLQNRFGNFKTVVDQYPGCAVGDVRVTKGESKSKAVALASIIARYVGLLQRKTLEEEAGFTIPLGSTHVENALFMLKEHGLPLNDFVKLHFKNVKKFFGN